MYGVRAIYPPPEIPPPSREGTVTLAQKAWEILGTEGTKENFYTALKLIYTVILWYRFVVRPPPPPRGEPSLCDRPPPPRGGNRRDKRGEISRGGYGLV